MLAMLLLVLAAIVIMIMVSCAIIKLFVTHDNNGLVGYHDNYRGIVTYTQNGKMRK